MKTIKKTYEKWTRAEIALECQKKGKHALASLIRSKSCPIEAARSLLIKDIDSKEYSVYTYYRGVEWMKKQIDIHIRRAGASLLLNSKGFIFGRVYQYGIIGSGRWSAYGNTPEPRACGWCRVVNEKKGFGKWVIVHEKKSKKSRVLKRILLSGRGFSHFEKQNPKTTATWSGAASHINLFC